MLNLLGGAPVDCADGTCGVLGWVAIDPDRLTITHIAVESRLMRSFGKLVPLGRVGSAGDRISLNCTTAEFEALDDADERELAMTGFRGSAAVISTDAVPIGEVHVGADEEIRTTDGTAGKLMGLTIEDGGKVSALLVEVGHLSKKHRVSVPGGFIRSLDAEGFDVALTKAQLGEL